MRSVLFTFDYELFLGARSGNPRECILDPTSRLLKLLQRFEWKGVFFVDTVYLMRLEEMAPEHPQAELDRADIMEQLAEIIAQGHTIFPHIHAHWLDAVYLAGANEWSLDNTRYYQFSSLPAGQQRTLFDASVQIIRSVGRKGEGQAKVDAYRAGGWSIQPFSHFKPFFLEYGIVHEWSVIPGKYHFSDAHSFDFRKAPAETPVYRFKDDVCQEDKSGPFTEWTISTLSMSRLEKWINFKISGYLHRTGRGPVRKGTTVSSVIREEGDLYSSREKIRGIASFEGLNPFTLRKYRSAIRRSTYFHFISHPKLITDFEFKMIDRLFRSLKKMGGIETDFRKAAL